MLAAIEAEGVEDLLHVVTQEWPLILGIDAVALSLIVGDKGFRRRRQAESSWSIRDPAPVDRAVDGVDMRKVERGHPLFGPACDLIRAEALIRIECDPPLPIGLLALGQRATQASMPVTGLNC